MIEIHELSKRYRTGDFALQPMNLTVHTGMFGLLGPNGAGKTTLLRILATLLAPSSGDVLIDGVSSLKHPEQARRRIGYLPQSFDVPGSMTGNEFLHYIAAMKGLNSLVDRKRETERWLDALNLRAAADRKIRAYSGGMKRRLGIAQAFIGPSNVVILDEPTIGLDPEERIRLRLLLMELSAERTILLSTHIVADIEHSCRSVAVLDGGRLKLSGDAETIRRTAENRVWEVELTDRELNRQEPWRIVSACKDGPSYRCRMLSEHRPCDDAKPLEPSLEDGYLSLIGGRPT